DVFERMGDEELLKKVTHGKTQNANESANSTIWNLLPKNGYGHLPLVELSTYMAVGLYNEGKITVLDVLDSLGIPVGKEMTQKCQQEDGIRISLNLVREDEKLSRVKRPAREDEKSSDEDEADEEVPPPPKKKKGRPSKV